MGLPRDYEQEDEDEPSPKRSGEEITFRSDFLYRFYKIFFIALAVPAVSYKLSGYSIELAQWFFIASEAVIGLVVLRRIFHWHSVRYMVGANHVRSESGILIKRHSGMPYNKIKKAYVKRSLIQRLFGVGDLHLSTAGSSHLVESWFGIKNPVQIKQIILERI